jgi:polar amino acid transport system permease protein
VIHDVISWAPALIKGTWVTIQVTLLSMAFAIVFGMVLVLPRLPGSRSRLLRTIATCVLEILRGTPLLVQIIYLYFVAPEMGINLPPFVAGVLALGLNYGAYLSEVYRGAIESIEPAQWESAAALGLGYVFTMRTVILPQCVRMILPTLVNYLVSLFKDSSLVSTISITELLFTGRLIASVNFKYTEVMTVVAVIYLVISLATARLGVWLQKKMRVGAAV